jgi:acyl dehydratase
MNLEILTTKPFAAITTTYGIKDTMLYALSVGASRDATDPVDLRLTYEKDLVALPSMASVLSSPGLWMRQPEYEIDWVRLLHGEQSIELKRPLPVEGTVHGHFRVVAVKDKGADKGASLFFERILKDENGEDIVTIRSTYVLRGDGGCGDWGEAPEALTELPDRSPDHAVAVPTLDNQALLYRLNGDFNPIHSDPEVARAAGFDRPIMHGLGSMGIACHALVREFCEGDPTRVSAMSLRFSKPFFPGETMALECFEEDGTVRFRARATERDAVVLDLGTLKLR